MSELFKVPFVQTGPSGCVSYSVANFFNDNRFIQETDYPKGEISASINKKMQLYKEDLFIETMYATNSYLSKSPNRLTDSGLFDMLWDKIPPEEKERQAVPYLFAFMRPSGKAHCILVVHNLKDNLFYVYDSIEGVRMVFEIEYFLQCYHVLTVEYFGPWTDVSDKIHILKPAFPHLFNHGE